MCNKEPLTSKPKVTLRSSLYGEFDLDELVDRLCHSHAPKPQQRDIYNAQIAILRLIEIMRAAPETFVIPVSPHMPKRERPAKAPSKSGLRYQQELAHYCGFRWQWLNLPPSEQLETLLEQLADAKDDALRLHHAYVDLKFPEMARPELKAECAHEWRDAPCPENLNRMRCRLCGVTS